MRGCSASDIYPTGPGHVPGLLLWLQLGKGALALLESTVIRQTANNLAKVAAMLTEEAFASGLDLASLSGDLNTLKAAADLSRRVARRQEARAAQADDHAPLCMGCQHRVDGRDGFSCALAMDTKEATAKRRCGQYKAE